MGGPAWKKVVLFLSASCSWVIRLKRCYVEKERCRGGLWGLCGLI